MIYRAFNSRLQEHDCRNVVFHGSYIGSWRFFVQYFQQFSGRKKNLLPYNLVTGTFLLV